MKFSKQKFTRYFNVIIGISFVLIGINFLRFEKTFYSGLFEIVLGLVFLINELLRIMKKRNNK